MKDKIIELLNSVGSGTPLSGVEMSRQLGISRVAIWKHLQQLKESGYAVVATPKGYFLESDRDLLLPLFFKERKDQIYFFTALSSTMDKARELARGGAANFSVVIAEEQSSGRGRLNRIWRSDTGGLWFTIILRPSLPPPLAFQVNFAASLSLARTLQHLYGLAVSVKWPNDLLLEGRKLAGLLSEMETHGDMISFVNIGIGLNVNNTPEIDEPNAVSIRTVLGEKICRRKLLSAFLDDFEKQLLDIQSLETYSVKLMEQWKQMTSTIGREVRIETFGDIYRGVAVDVDLSGALIIRQEDGIEKKIIYGDCFHHDS